MKVKLLRKIRKRFSWTHQKKKGKKDRWLIVDHHKKETIFLDQDYAKSQWKNIKGKPGVGWKEYKFRLFKQFILAPFISRPLTKLMYKGAVNLIRKKNKHV